MYNRCADRRPLKILLKTCFLAGPSRCLSQQYVRHFAATVFAPKPKLALRYSEAALA